MKLKSTLWALAFACAAVSCSDELEEGGNGTGIIAEDGEGVYLTVNMASSSTGAMTKAGNEAEDGTGDPLKGSEEERKVHDVNIYLIKASEITDLTSGITSEADGVKIASATGTIKIIGHGYSSDITETGHVSDHTANTVMIQIDQNDVPESETMYYVFAVANLGKSIDFADLATLRDAVKAPADAGTDWSGAVWSGSAEYGKASKFVMSTHQMYDSNIAEPSSVMISQENMNPNNPANTTVYIERLAARIDLQVAEAFVKTDGEGQEVDNPILVEDDDETPSTGADTEETPVDYVKLTGYQVVNRWKGDEYLFKRVTNEVTRASATADYPSIPTDNTSYKYLGDEIWTDGTASTWKYNYVIDPKTSEKNANSIASLASSYDNHYAVELNNNLTVGGTGAFTAMTGIKTDEFTPVIYTKENTLDLDNQVAGLVTAVIFQGTYSPNAVSRFTITGGADKNQVGVIKDVFNLDTDKGFYVVNDHQNDLDSRYICADLKTVAALAFESIKGEKWGGDLMKALFDASTSSWGTVSLDNLKTAVAGMKGGKLVAAYQTFLEEKLGALGATATDLTNLGSTTVNWSAFMTAMKAETDEAVQITDPKDITNAADFAEASKSLYDNYNVAYYKGGECYYPYWIRHENNSTDVTAPMEFCIVRNNVYQLNVTGVSALGYPLPFITDPTTPVEDQSVFLTVEIYVKDWVVRTQEDEIIL